ncbi:MAG: Foldase protein PrsA precursor [Labilithrix sp.]|nr:Foldase protein PrsA precursor [Labilithrix sp.]
MQAAPSRALIVLALAAVSSLAACAGNPPAPAQPPVARVAPATTMPPELPPLLVEYVVVHRRWVEKLVPVAAADVKAWSEAPANASAVSGPLRHILVKVPGGEKDPGVAARKKAQTILARLDKGEDFAKVAGQLSEDATTKDRGGELPAEKSNELAPPVASAFAALEPGKTAREPVRSPEGFHILHKDRAADEHIERAYRRAMAPDVAKRLAEELLVRLKAADVPARAAIAEATQAVLGERGASDASRPAAQSVPRDRIEQVRLSAAAKAAIETFARSAHPGDVLPSPAIDGDTIVVARAVAPSAR